MLAPHSLSLNARVVLAAMAVLVGFFGITGVTLDSAYRQSEERALQERLQGQLYTLIAATELVQSDRIKMPQHLPEERLSRTDSGLYARIVDRSGAVAWQSPSLMGSDIEFVRGLARTERHFARVESASGGAMYVFSFGVAWGEAPEGGQVYTFSVGEDIREFDSRVASFRGTLWAWLCGVGLLLLAVQGAILRWGLAPLRRAAEEIRQIEAGTQSRLLARYPSELATLTSNINALLDQQQERMARSRNALGDLAHSLKTPLAVLQSAVEKTDDAITLSVTVQEQVDRMARIAEYQLQRAAASGAMVLAKPLPVAELADKVIASLDKVYAERRVQCEATIDRDARFYGDEGDALEILGNLLDNAYKWCRQRVGLGVEQRRTGDSQWLVVIVEDDGPGIPEQLRQQVLGRGVRADSQVTGHGIGLAIVQQIAALMGGLVEIGVSERLGGARVELRIPQPR